MWNLRMATIEQTHGWGKGFNPHRVPELARIITVDPTLKHLLTCLPQYAASQLPVLLLGEPGTGKELVAEALWALSPRRRQPFLRLNCATLMDSLAHSELFGHLRGAFTDAQHTRAGKFKAAHGGTLFLDELGDLPLSVQPKLLRAVEHGEIEPVGGDAPVKVDVRLVAATNQSIPKLIARGRFRQDLYDRLAVLVIDLPPLRERLGDVEHLARYLVLQEGASQGRNFVGLTAGAVRRLQDYHWPGNVRELKNVITRAVLFSTGSYLKAQDLYFTQPQTKSAFEAPALADRPARRQLEELIREEGGNISALARRLHVCSKTVYRWLRSYHIDLERLRTAGA